MLDLRLSELALLAAGAAVSLAALARRRSSTRPKLGVRDNSRLSVSHAAPGANLASSTKAGYAWPVQQAHDSMLTLLAEAAAAARKIARVKKVVADKARTEAVQSPAALARSSSP